MEGVSTQLIIDSYLGSGQYNDWQEMESQKRSQDERYRRSVQRMGSYIREIGDQIWADQTLLEKLASEYRQAMALIAKGRRISTDQVAGVSELYSLALEVVHSENEILEMVIRTNLHGWMSVIPFDSIEAKAESLAAWLHELVRTMRALDAPDAEEAVAAAIAAGQVAVRDAGLLTRLGTTISEYIQQETIGGGLTARQEGGARMGPTLDAIDRLREQQARLLNGNLPTTGESRTAMERVSRAYASLFEELDAQAQNLYELKVAIVITELRIRDARMNARISRNALEAAIAHQNYPTRTPLSWMLN